MTAAELAAYIGAAAWLPQIAAWLYKSFAKPILTVIPDARVELGYTPIGPIFNVRLALSADRKDIVIRDFRLRLVHEDGDAHVLRWAGMEEEIGLTRDALGMRQGRLTKKHERPIALKVGMAGLMEKLVRFNEPRYKEVDDPPMEKLVEHFTFLKRTDPNYVHTALQSKEFHAVAEARAQAFWWKAGNYDVICEPLSPSRLRLKNERFTLRISQSSADKLRKNIPDIRAQLENTIKSNLPDFKVPTLYWEWAYEELKASH